MDLQLAGKLAIAEMDKYHLISKGWTFRFDNARRRFGLCRYTTKTIYLSRHLVGMNAEAEVLNIIRHEVAHALAGSAAGHGRLWKLQCLVTGARPERCYSQKSGVQVPKGRYQGTCQSCGLVLQRFKRPSTAMIFTGRHTRCKYKANGGNIEWSTNGRPLVSTAGQFVNQPLPPPLRQHQAASQPAPVIAVEPTKQGTPLSETLQSDIIAMWERLKKLEGRI